MEDRPGRPERAAGSAAAMARTRCARQVLNMMQRLIRQAEVAVLTPSCMDHVKAGADEIKRGNPLIINFGSLNQEERMWAMHFLNGVVYAVDGQSVELSSRVYLFSPRDVVVSEE